MADAEPYDRGRVLQRHTDRSRSAGLDGADRSDHGAAPEGSNRLELKQASYARKRRYDNGASLYRRRGKNSGQSNRSQIYGTGEVVAEVRELQSYRVPEPL